MRRFGFPALALAIALSACCVHASVFKATLPLLTKIREYEEVQWDNPTVHVKAVMKEPKEPLTYVAYPRAHSKKLFGALGRPDCCDPKNPDVGFDCVNYISVNQNRTVLDLTVEIGLIPTANFSTKKPYDKQFKLVGAGSDHYFVSLHSCVNHKEEYDLLNIDVELGFSNSWGFLPYNRFPVFCIIFSGLFLYIAFIIWYSVLLLRFWSEVLTLQKLVMALIICGFFEGVFIVSEFGYWNTHAWHSSFLMGVSSLLITTKKVAARTLFLFVAQGYGVVKPVLPNPKIVFTLGVIYVIAELYFQVTESKWIYTDVPLKERGRLTFVPVYLVDSVIMLLCVSALVQTIKILWVRKANQSEKLKIYLWSLIGFTLFVVSNVLYMILNLIEEKETTVKSIWKIEWFNLPLLYFGFLLTLIQMAALWRPTENNMRYSYIPPTDERDGDEDDEWAVANDNIKMKSGIYGNIQRRRQPKKADREPLMENRDLQEDGNATETLNWIENNVPASSNEVTVAAFVLDDEDIEDMKKEIAHLD